jgi:hypothetical protein
MIFVSMCESLHSLVGLGNPNTMATLARILTTIAVMLVLPFQSFDLFSQDKRADKEKSAASQPTYKLPVGVVVVNASVTDKQGNAITDLTQKDFRVYEDGKLQEIQTFALESYRPILPRN